MAKLTDKEQENKMKELKIELLKNNLKRKGIKREIARLLTPQLNERKEKKK